MTASLSASVSTDGQLIWTHPHVLTNALMRFKGKQVDVEIRKHVRKRSLEQNKLYWKCIVERVWQLMNAQGNAYTREQAHDFLRDMHLRVEVVNPLTGEIMGHRTMSTTELSVEEFTEYIEKCNVWCCEFFGVNLLEDK